MSKTSIIIDALEIVWRKDDENKIDEIASIKRATAELTKYIEQKVESATNDSYSSIKGDILKIIDKKKNELSDLEIRLKKLTDEEDDDKKEFMEFALSFITDTGKHFLEPYVSKANRLVCKQILFPSGISIDSDRNVYTAELSPLIRLATNKKDLPKLEKSSLVRVQGL